MEQLAHRAVADAEGERDLLIAQPVDLAQQDRVTLALRKRLDGRHRGPQPLPQLERLVGPLHAVHVLVELVVAPAVLAQKIQRSVVRDPVEPRAQVQVRVP